MPRKKKDTKQTDLLNVQDRLTTAACVPAIREALRSWREGGYKGVTNTTHELLNFWFYSDHRLPNGNSFRYHTAQREAIETLIYLYEVVKVRNRKTLLEKYAFNTKDLRLPPYDDFARYCIKMATGSGKTKVMALAVTWQYFNAVRENSEEFASSFLVIAPNIIVFDRLQSDFANGRVFRADPLFPKHYELFWDMEFYMRGDSERAGSTGGFYLTNIQQFYERADRKAEAETDVMRIMLGSPPPSIKAENSDFAERIAKREGLLMVLNDEAHHTHDEDSEWNRVIRRLHEKKTLSLQLDVSATPRFQKGGLFPWVVFDYPLKQAIIDGIVKRPIKGISKIVEARSNIASVRYKGFLTAGVERWKEYRKELKPLNKKPILFVMMNNTEEADEVGDWLQSKYPSEFGGEKTLIIHTDKSGEVSKKDVEEARRAAKEVDDETSPVNAIVSVLMLREGWDVQNVTVVVGLRPYTSKADILPEQTIGRGLRLMFRQFGNQFTERVDIIGNKAFMTFVEDLEKLEDLKLESFEIGKDKLKIITIQPDPKKLDKDIGLPELSPLLTRKKTLSEEIAALNVMNFRINILPLKGKDIDKIESFIYEGIDILTKVKLLEREYTIPAAQTAEEVIGYYARQIATNLKLPSQFADLVPKIRDFFERKAFGKTVNLQEPEVIRAIGSNLANFVVTKEFQKALRDIIVEEKQPELINVKRMLSSTPPFPFSRAVHKSDRTVFNFVACSNEFERAFARFLDEAEEVDAYAKLPEQFGFCIQYTDNMANIRNYYPDFIAKLNDDRFFLIETKGREDVEVRMKDEAAKNWCSNACALTGDSWNYIKVLQKEFEQLQPESFEELETGLH